MIIWTPEAQVTFDAIFRFVEAQWGKRHAANFLSRTLRLLRTIEAQPYIGKEITPEGTRRAHISKYCSIHYLVSGDVIRIGYVWDNRQEPII